MTATPNQPGYLCDKSVEIANEVLKETGNEDWRSLPGLSKARAYFKDHQLLPL